MYVNRLGDYDVELVDDWADIHLGTGMILFTDNKGNVEYAIYVGDVMSLYDVEDAPLAAVEDLFWAIVRDAAYVPTDFEAAMAKAEAAIVTGTIEALTEAKKALEDLYTVKADGSIVHQSDQRGVQPLSRVCSPRLRPSWLPWWLTKSWPRPRLLPLLRSRRRKASGLRA